MTTVIASRPQAPARSRVAGSRTIGGYVIVYNSPSRLIDGSFYETVAPGAVSRSLRDGSPILSYWNHDRNSPLASTNGHSLRLYDEPRGLRYEIDLADTTAGNDVLQLVRKRIVTNSSFGFSAKRPGSDAWSQRDGKRYRTLLDIDLLDVSPCCEPAYPATSCEMRSDAAQLRSWQLPNGDDWIDAQLRQEFPNYYDADYEAGYKPPRISALAVETTMGNGETALHGMAIGPHEHINFEKAFTGALGTAVRYMDENDTEFDRCYPGLRARREYLESIDPQTIECERMFRAVDAEMRAGRLRSCQTTGQMKNGHYVVASMKMFKHTTAAAMLVQASSDTAERS